jgi:hypothetical protein
MERREDSIWSEKQTKDENLEFARCALFGGLNAPRSSTAQDLDTPAAVLAVAPILKVRTSEITTGRLEDDKDLEDLERERCELFADANKRLYASAAQASAAQVFDVTPSKREKDAQPMTRTSETATVTTFPESYICEMER